jgi:hypothetical protein
MLDLTIVQICLYSRTTKLIEAKLYMNVYWMVLLYKVCFFIHWVLNSTMYTKFIYLFFTPIGNPRWSPPTSTGQNKTKLDRNVHCMVLYIHSWLVYTVSKKKLIYNSNHTIIFLENLVFSSNKRLKPGEQFWMHSC